MNNHHNDLTLVELALSGDERAAGTIYNLRPQLINHLTSKGAPSGSISEDVVADLLGDCFGARERSARASTNRLLELYKGDGPLLAWLKRSCWNEFLDTGNGIAPVPLTDRGEGDTCSYVHSDCGSIEPDAKSRAGAALEYAFSEIDPIQLIYLRLVFLEDVSKKEVAKAFGCHPSNVGRKLNKGVKTLRTKTEAFQKRHPDSDRIEWSDLLAICKTPPDFFYEN